MQWPEVRHSSTQRFRNHTDNKTLTQVEKEDLLDGLSQVADTYIANADPNSTAETQQYGDNPSRSSLYCNRGCYIQIVQETECILSL